MPAVITLLTDFGDADAFVGILKGVILAIAPEARIVDLSHHIPAQQVVPAALVLRSAVPFFPLGTVHLAVVDPGVGSERRAIAIQTRDAILVGPDNGVLMAAAEDGGIVAVHRIDNPELERRQRSNTFHGRDLFAPVAAHLASGITLDSVGPRIADPQPLALPKPRVGSGKLQGEVVYVDHFGNLITNIPGDVIAGFRDHSDSVSIAGVSVIGPVPAYAAVPDGAALAIVNSWNVMEIAVRNGNAAKQLNATIGARVDVRLEARPNE